jgi:predicted component of type VI protein secretion system
VESVVMNQHVPETPEQVLRFAPKDRPRQNGDTMDQSGQTIVSMLEKAADLSNENCDRAMTLAHKLSIQLRAAEEQIGELQREVAHFQDRASRAETWMALIQKEIEEKLLAPRGNNNRPKPPPG